MCSFLSLCCHLFLLQGHPREAEGLVTLSADMHGYCLVSDEGRNGRRGGEWWESPEAFTLGDKDQQQNKNRLLLED